jgi:hypothetical protein
MGSNAVADFTFKRDVPCASLHKDEAKMHASPKKRSSKKKANAIGSDSDEFKLGSDADDEDESIVANTIPESRSSKKKANVIDSDSNSTAAPAPTIEGEVPCASPPVDEDNEDGLKFGIVANLAVKYDLVCANPEDAQELINFVMDHVTARKS